MKAKMTRRILALVLSVVMVLAIIPAAFASEFPDVKDDAWYAAAVDYCFDNSLMSGTGKGFEPNGKVTREMAVQTLYAMTGSPATAYEAKFKDVPDGKWYTNPIMWGAKNKIVNGYDNGKFGVGDFVTREQVAMFFYNYATFAGIDEDFASLAGFPDANKVSSWAKTAVQWAVAMGVLSGKSIDGKNYLKPQDPLTRAELASILARFHEKYIGDEVLCNHEETETRNAKPATCTEDGYTGDTYCLNPDCHLKGEAIEKGKTIPALGHDFVDGFCSRCGEPDPDKGRTFTLSDELPAGTQVIIYSPGHGMVVTNETDNDWYLVPEERTPDGDRFTEEEFGDFSNFVWDVVDNGDGTVSFVNGDNMIAAWVSGTYIELTNKADYEGADTKWIVTFVDGLAYIQSATLSNSYGPAYIECYYNANKDKTNISGYTSGDPTAKSNDFGFQIYVSGNPCEHAWDDGVVTAPTCTEDGYTLFTCSLCGATKKDNIISAAGHNYVDGVCTVCGAKEKVFTLSEELADGMQVVIYNPGHGMAIKNENDNNWYLVPEVITPDGDKIVSPDDSIVWTVVDNGDGTISFVNGDNAIAAWLSGTYIELTNDANYDGADTKWIVTFIDGLGYIQSSSLSNSYGPAYIECYYNANKDKTNISGYTSSNPSSKSGDFGFQFYVKGNPCEHDWVAGTPVAATCTEDGYTPYTCSKCNAAKKGDIVPATGHIDEDENGKCDVCRADLNNSFVLASEIKDGDQVVIYNPGHGMAISNENDNNWYLVPVAITPEDDAISDPDAALVWTVVDNGDGTFSFVNGDNAIVAWLSGTYIELTNDANYAGADGKWIVTFSGDYAYIQSSTLSNSYGPAYIECYYNANKDKTNISGYTSGDPTAKPDDFGFQFYVKGGEPIKPCEHDWVAGTPVAANCTEDGYTPYTCSKCQATKNDDVVPATGHNFGGDNVCDTCGYVKGEGFALTDALSDGMDVILVNPGSKNAVKAAVKASYYVDLQKVEIVDDQIETEDASIIWSVSENDDGTYTFTSGNNILCVGVNGTHTNLLVNAADGTYNAWTLVPATSAKTFFVKSTIPANEKGDFYLEYNGSYSEFTIYGSTAPDEAAFGIQFYAKGGCEHDWVAGTPVSATCTEGAYTPYTCSKCSAGKKEVTSAALGHDWVADPENSVAPGCVTAGINAFKCSRCPATTTEAGDPATGHIDVAPADGICDVCEKDLTAAGYTAATSIAVGDKIIIVAAHSEKNYAVVGVKGTSDTSVNNALSAREVKLDGNAIADASVDEAAIVWEVVAGSASGTYMLKASDGKYMAYTASGTTLKTDAAGTDFAITCGAGTATLMATADGMTDRGVSFRNNAGTPQFRMYKASNNSGEYSWALTIYKLG